MYFPVVGMCVCTSLSVMLAIVVCIICRRSWNSWSSSGCGCGCAPGSSGDSSFFNCCFADLQKVSVIFCLNVDECTYLSHTHTP